MKGVTKGETCASCTHFPRQALEAGGPYQCDRREILAAWDYPACVLWNMIRSEDERKARRRIIEARGKDPDP